MLEKCKEYDWFSIISQCRHISGVMELSLFFIVIYFTVFDYAVCIFVIAAFVLYHPVIETSHLSVLDFFQGETWSISTMAREGKH